MKAAWRKAAISSGSNRKQIMAAISGSDVTYQSGGGASATMK